MVGGRGCPSETLPPESVRRALRCRHDTLVTREFLRSGKSLMFERFQSSSGRVGREFLMFE